MYKIDETIFRKNFFSNKGEFKHVPNTHFKDLPFTTKDGSIVKDFDGVIGEYVRILLGKKLKESINQEEILKTALDLTACDEKEQYALKQIIKHTYFAEDGNMHVFSNKALAFVNVKQANDKKIAHFLYDVLNVEELREEVKSCFEAQADNVLDALMYASIPPLEGSRKSESSYVRMVPYVSIIFMEDFKYILKDQERVRKYLKPLLTYYYFFYISQLSVKLNQFFEADPEKVEELFFSVEWEKLSKSRQCYNYGWKKLERNVKNIFSHSKLLEMLNQNDSKVLAEKITYIDLARDAQSLEGSSFEDELSKMLHLYMASIIDYDFAHINREQKYESNVLNDIIYFFECIDAQFIAKRDRPYNGYSKWFVEFSKANWLKNRRSLGYSLNLTEDDLIFLTKIAMKDRDKMKLKDLYTAYESRGIFLDQKSKEEIHNYFEKLNLIEKKSDSGDAQYVKGIL